jgi:choline dehydrogenase-like flavoprotein
VQIAIEQRPSWQNQIRLASERDALGVPKAELYWLPRDEDERTFETTAARLRSYWSRIGLDARCPLTWLVGGEGQPERYVDRADAYAHPSGSSRMGTDPATSVVGPDLVCHAIPNLSVASAAVFPSSGSANPTFTILQLALRHADSLLRKATQAVAATPRQAGSVNLAVAMAPLSASATRATSSSSI